MVAHYCHSHHARHPTLQGQCYIQTLTPAMVIETLIGASPFLFLLFSRLKLTPISLRITIYAQKHTQFFAYPNKLNQIIMYNQKHKQL